MVAFLSWLLATCGLIYLIQGSYLFSPFRRFVWEIASRVGTGDLGRRIVHRLYCTTCASPWIAVLASHALFGITGWALLANALIAVGTVRLLVGSGLFVIPVDPWVFEWYESTQNVRSEAEADEGRSDLDRSA